MLSMAAMLSQYTIAAGNTKWSRERLYYRRTHLNGYPPSLAARVSDTTTKRREIQPRSFMHLKGHALSFIAELSGITSSPGEIQPPSFLSLSGFCASHWKTWDDCSPKWMVPAHVEMSTIEISIFGYVYLSGILYSFGFESGWYQRTLRCRPLRYQYLNTCILVAHCIILGSKADSTSSH